MEKLEKIFVVILLGCIAGVLLNLFFGFRVFYTYAFFVTIGVYLIIKLITHGINLVKKPKKKKSYNKSRNFLIGVGIFIISVLIVRNTSFVIGFIYTNILCFWIGSLIYRKKIAKKKKLVRILYISCLVIFFVFISSIIYSFFCTFFISFPNYEHASDGSWKYIKLTSFGFIPEITYPTTIISIGKTNGFGDNVEHIGTSDFGIFFYSEKEFPKICLDAITLPHFRTNVKTGECSFFPGSGCLVEMPKNYVQGCNKSLEEKADVLKNINYWNENISWFDKITQNCTNYCNERYEPFFCYAEEGTRNLCEELAEYR